MRCASCLAQALLLAACHVVVVVADGVHDLHLWRLLLHADMLITSLPTLFTVRLVVIPNVSRSLRAWSE
jgi:hypothetical protein